MNRIESAAKEKEADKNQSPGHSLGFSAGGLKRRWSHYFCDI
jgi:hypothetical protein